jgi:hypothetical protein
MRMKQFVALSCRTVQLPPLMSLINKVEIIYLKISVHGLYPTLCRDLQSRWCCELGVPNIELSSTVRLRLRYMEDLILERR